VALFNTPAAGKGRKGVFRMKKLLLVMLVPLLVLGVMGCGGDFVAGNETDAYLQGNWAGVENVAGSTGALVFFVNSLEDYGLAISAGQLTVIYQDLVFPFRTEFTYFDGNRALDLEEVIGTSDSAEEILGILGDDFFDAILVAAAGDDFEDDFSDDWQLLTNSGQNRVMAGTLRLFRYEDNLELVDINVILAFNSMNLSNRTLIITDIIEIEEAWYIKSLPIPPVGAYELASGDTSFS